MFMLILNNIRLRCSDVAELLHTEKQNLGHCSDIVPIGWLVLSLTLSAIYNGLPCN